MKATFYVTLLVCGLLALPVFAQEGIREAATVVAEEVPTAAEAPVIAEETPAVEAAAEATAVEAATATEEAPKAVVEGGIEIVQEEYGEETEGMLQEEDTARVPSAIAEGTAIDGTAALEHVTEEDTFANVEHPETATEIMRAGTKLGVLWLESATGHTKAAYELTRALIQQLDNLGLYEIYYPEDIDRALGEARVRIPGGCRDPKCIHDIGKGLGFRRMIYGSMDIHAERVGVRLKLFNVATGRIIETVSIEGAPGIPAEVVMATAVNRLHGRSDRPADMSEYHGPLVNNIKEFLWSTVAVQGTGLFYGLINYGIGNSGGEPDIEYDRGAYRSGEVLSGISASSNQIPMFARPAALANAYMAVSDDAYGVLYNPAGMAWVMQRDMAMTYQYRFGMDLLAVSYANKSLRDFGFGQAILLATDRDGAMTELFFMTAMAYKINQSAVFGPMSVGATVKLMSNSVRALSLDSPKGQSYGMGLDLGFMWELSHDIRYGLTFRDLPAGNRWRNKTTGEQYTEAQPPTMHMGGLYKASYSVILVADGQIPLYSDQPWKMAGGIEYEFLRLFALRIGMQREIQTEEANWWNITGGAGFKFDTRSAWGRNMILDLAYEYSTLNLFPVVNVSLRLGL